MPDYSSIRTSALREILSHSSFGNPAARRRIDDLMTLEAWLVTQPHGMAANMSFGVLQRRYPVEALRFRAELREGIYRSQAEAEALLARQAEAEARAAAEKRAVRAQVLASAEERARTDWLAAGGCA